MAASVIVVFEQFSYPEADLGLLQHPRWSAFTKCSILDVAAARDPPLVILDYKTSVWRCFTVYKVYLKLLYCNIWSLSDTNKIKSNIWHFIIDLYSYFFTCVLSIKKKKMCLFRLCFILNLTKWLSEKCFWHCLSGRKHFIKFDLLLKINWLNISYS